MKYLIKDSKIIRAEGSIPEVFEIKGRTIFGYHLLSPEDHYAHGWRDEVLTEYDPELQQLGDPYYKKSIDAVTRDVIERTDLPTLYQAKADKISQIKEAAYLKLSITDWYGRRKLENGKEIPDVILAERESIRQRSNKLEAQVNALETYKEIVLFEIS